MQLRPHCGEGNFRWVMHLGLDVPSGVAITVGGKTVAWEEGKVIVFDDSYLHSVEHNGDRDRVVLAMQVRSRPVPAFSRVLGTERVAACAGDEPGVPRLARSRRGARAAAAASSQEEDPREARHRGRSRRRWGRVLKETVVLISRSLRPLFSHHELGRESVI